MLVGKRTASRAAVSHPEGDDVYDDWEAVYRDNVAWVYQLMVTKVGSAPDAEDLTAEVFLAALRPLRLSVTVAEVRAYLLATARTVLATYWRRTLGREVTALHEETVAAVLLDAPADSGAAARARKILAALPVRYRRILQLRFLDGRTIKEAATELGITAGNAKVLQHRALRQAEQVAAEMEDGHA